MVSIAASNGAINFTPRGSSSYFYESIKCQQALSNGYGGLQFNVIGPVGGSVALELQTVASCSSSTTNYTSSYNVITDLTGRSQTIQLPWDGFDNAPNADSIIGFSWAEFTGNGAWTVANISLICGSVAGSISPSPFPFLTFLEMSKNCKMTSNGR